jgi:hypothetical protein
LGPDHDEGYYLMYQLVLAVAGLYVESIYHERRTRYIICCDGTVPGGSHEKRLQPTVPRTCGKRVTPDNTRQRQFRNKTDARTT